MVYKDIGEEMLEHAFEGKYELIWMNKRGVFSMIIKFFYNYLIIIKKTI